MEIARTFAGIVEDGISKFEMVEKLAEGGEGGNGDVVLVVGGDDGTMGALRVSYE